MNFVIGITAGLLWWLGGACMMLKPPASYCSGILTFAGGILTGILAGKKDKK